METEKKFAVTLSTRVRNALIGCFGCRDIICHPEIIAMGRKKLTFARNIGPKALREIAGALHKFGYINDPDRWFQNKR